MCVQTISRQTYHKYVPPPPLVEKYEVVKTVQVLATKYIKPQRKDYPNEKKYLAAIKINGTGEKTATGTRPGIGTIAANFNRFPEGTLVRIKDANIQLGIIEDTGATMRKNPQCIDIFSNSKEDAENWGRRLVTMEILIKKTNRG